MSSLWGYTGASRISNKFTVSTQSRTEAGSTQRQYLRKSSHLRTGERGTLCAYGDSVLPQDSAPKALQNPVASRLLPVLQFKKSTALLTALLLLLPACVFAAGPGTSAATFLKLGFGARPLGLGEAYVAVADDAAALHYNPAGLAYGPSVGSRQSPKLMEMMVSHSMHVQDIRLSQMGLIKRPWGVSITHLGVGGIERRSSETAAPEGEFGASDLMMGFSYARKVLGVGVGGTVKIIRQTIGEYSASAYAVDFGTLYRMKSRPISLGFSVTNLGTKVTFIERGSPLPLTVRVGATYGLTPRFPHALSAQIDLPRDGGPILRLGMEYLGFGPFALRAGYRTSGVNQRSAALGRALGADGPGLSEFYGMFMGVGFRSKMGSMDYALLPFGELGNAHRFSFTLRFGMPPKKGKTGALP